MRELTFRESNKVSGGRQVCSTKVICDECGCVIETVCLTEEDPLVPII
jgi:hypothetical protein